MWYVIGIIVGACFGFMVCAILSAGKNADIISELLPDAQNWQRVVSELTARGWTYITPVTVTALLPKVTNRYAIVEDSEMP